MRRLRSIGAGSGDEVDLVGRLERLRAPVELGVMMLAERDRLVIGDLKAGALPSCMIDMRGLHAAIAIGACDQARAAAEPLNMRREATLGVSLAAVAMARADVDAHHATTRHATMSDRAP